MYAREWLLKGLSAQPEATIRTVLSNTNHHRMDTLSSFGHNMHVSTRSLFNYTAKARIFPVYLYQPVLILDRFIRKISCAGRESRYIWGGL
jgi:hypothetical protein